MEVDISGNIAENDGQKQRRSPRWKPGISVHATKCTSSDGSFERPVRSLFERTLSLTVRMLCVFLYFLCGEGCSRERPSVDLRMSNPHLLVVFHATCLPSVSPFHLSYVYPICESLVDVRSLVMLTTVFLVCSDDGMGRFDRETISQQSLIELFIIGFDTAEDICGSRDDPREVCAWEGIKCNADGEVKGFQWGRKGEDGDGTVGLAFLPLSMTYLSVYDGALRGTFHLHTLPENMEILTLQNNRLNGTLNRANLLATMQRMSLGRNTFRGKISLEHLPKRLHTFGFERNQLEATLWWVGLVPRFVGSQDPFKPSSCFCHGADPIDGHRKVVGQDEYPALGEVRETAT